LSSAWAGQPQTANGTSSASAANAAALKKGSAAMTSGFPVWSAKSMSACTPSATKFSLNQVSSARL
jgi:hypothetical protein